MILDANGKSLEAIASEFQSAGDPMAAGGRYEQIVGMGSGLRFLTYFNRGANRGQRFASSMCGALRSNE